MSVFFLTKSYISIALDGGRPVFVEQKIQMANKH